MPQTVSFCSALNSPRNRGNSVTMETSHVQKNGLVDAFDTGASSCACCADDKSDLLRKTRPPYELRPAIRTVDLFAGCGAMTLGVALAASRYKLGIDIPLALDLDTDAVNVFRRNFPLANVRQQSVEEVFNGSIGEPPTRQESKSARDVGAVDVLVGGPPCQGNSNLNNHTRFRDSRNALYGRMARAAEICRPTTVIVENVPAVLRDSNSVVRATMDALEASGYNTAQAVVDLSHIGVPQTRRRHVFLAVQGDKVSAARVLERLEQQRCHHVLRPVSWAIDDLEDPIACQSFDQSTRVSDENAKRISWLFENDKHDLPNALRPSCHRGEHRYTSMYGRLHWDRPAQTITTGFGSMGQGRYVHPTRPRLISPHEAARLQFLPDHFTFSAAKGRTAWARLIGNAVPPLLTRLIVESLMSLFVPACGEPPDLPEALATQGVTPSPTAHPSVMNGRIK